MNVVDHIFGELYQHEKYIKSLIKKQRKMSILVDIGFVVTAIGFYTQKKMNDILVEQIKELKQEKGE